MNQLTAAEILPSAPEEVREERIEMVEYVRSVLRRKWSILSLAIAIALLASVVVSSLKPVYRASALVLLETNKAKVVSVEEIYSGFSGNRELFQTQAEIIKSREIAKKVVAKLNLAKHPDFDPRQREPSLWRRWARSLGMMGEAGQISDEAAEGCLLYTSPSPRDGLLSRMPSSA